ncbi:histidinol-phosphate aminotransferase family protein [Candidatus Woesebacteria bacterium]|nr:histidinol-phosphate aminotransferase family protein [Candidatus Woesebacteria bacterium]
MENNISKSVSAIAKSVTPSRANYTHQVENPEDFLRFDLTEGICWFPELVKEWVSDIPVNSVVHYPSASTTKLQELMAQWLSIPSSQIAVGNGSDELIELLPQIFLHSGDECLIVTPTFFRFAEASARAGARTRAVALQAKDRFSWTSASIKSFREEIQRTSVKLIWLSSPNNPTGISVPDEVVDIAVRSGKIVVIDKVLNGFTDELRSAGDLVAKHTNVIILSGFSKTFGLPGLRLGFAIADPSIAQLLRERRLPFSMSGVSQFLFERFMESLLTQKIQTPNINELHKRRLWLESKIRNLASIEIASDSSTNILLLKSRSGSSLFSKLKTLGILVTDLNEAVGIQGLGFVRMAVRSQHENEQFVAKIAQMKE